MSEKLTREVIPGMEVLDVLQCEVFILGEKLRSTIKDPATGRALINRPLQLRNCCIDIAGQTTALSGIREGLSHATELGVWLSFALNASHRTDESNPYERNSS